MKASINLILMVVIQMLVLVCLGFYYECYTFKSQREDNQYLSCQQVCCAAEKPNKKQRRKENQSLLVFVNQLCLTLFFLYL